MNHVKALRSIGYPTAVLIFACASLALGVGWRSAAFQNKKTEGTLSQEQTKQIFHAKLRDGLGKEIKFVHSKNSSEKEVRDSVESAANFIQQRSELKLSGNAKERLAHMERQHLAGENRAISVAELADALTETAMQRLSRTTDAEVDQTAVSLNREDDGIILRANGRGHIKESEFVAQAKAMRNLSRQDDATLRANIHTAVKAELNDRVKDYSEALPTEFGDAPKKGVTPLQAFVITYSVASDDLLADSQATLKRKVGQVHQTMKDKGYTQNPKPDKAYGTKGYFFASPLDLLFDEPTTTTLFDEIEKRSKQ